jgi:hypothetical protein
MLHLTGTAKSVKSVKIKNTKFLKKYIVFYNKKSLFSYFNDKVFNEKLWDNILSKDYVLAGCLWLMPVILATQEAEIRSSVVQSQPRQIVARDPISKNPSQK